ncbi:hypothetical protein GCM10011390_10430 [Aureimonas endophytica]|uniref:Uncharacterized protein n=1 Tax=Aureimonas endophytica TaxID=2027858 RepID=A0A916ZF77_9HYPH|nr:hypothetical protein [Aureimonas endophytica]GGD93583.1 hypothetical protein GCM10011390_10430 [Aureimonas endophytica]
MAGVLSLIAAHRAAFAEFNALLHAKPVDDAAQKAADAEAHAILFELFAAPATDPASASAKAGYLLEAIHDDLCDYFQEERHIRALLSSFVPQPASPAVVPKYMRHIEAAGDIGRQLADMAVLMFSDIPPSLRQVFADSLAEGMPEMFEDWSAMPEGSRNLLQNVAATVFDRRLAIHQAAGLLRGGQA